LIFSATISRIGNEAIDRGKEEKASTLLSITDVTERKEDERNGPAVQAGLG